MLGWLKTEAAGWRAALADPANVRTIIQRLILVAVSSTVSVAAAGYIEPTLAVLGAILLVLVLSLVSLRATGRP